MEIRKQAEEWDKNNPKMPSIKVPEGYKAKYTYELPVIYHGTGVPNLPINISHRSEDNLMIVTIVTYNEINSMEIKEYQRLLKRENIEHIGNIRLIKQSFSLDNTL